MSTPCSFVRAASLLVVVTAAACGDGQRQVPDARAADAPLPSPDAAVCEATGYPQRLRALSVDLQAPFTLALGGTGTRCEQLVRALTDPDSRRRPPELAELDVVGVTGTCRHDPDTNRDVVRLAAPLFGGLPLFAPVQDVVAHVDATDTVVFLHGDFLPASAPRPPAACVDPAGLPATIPGATLTYAWFDRCQIQGEGMYTVAGSDAIDVGAEGYVIDADGAFRRVRAVDVFVAVANLTDQLVNSELYCCDGSTVEGCIGARLLVDALTGELVTQQARCHAC